MGLQWPSYLLNPSGGAALPLNSSLGLPAPCRNPCTPEKLQQAWLSHGTICLIIRQSFQDGLLWGRNSWVHSGPASFSIPRGCCTPAEQLPSTTSPLQGPIQTRKARTSLARQGKVMPKFSVSPSESGCTVAEPPVFSVTQIPAPSRGGVPCTPAEQLPSTIRPLQEPYSPKTPDQALLGRVKSAPIMVWISQSCLPSGSPPLL